MTGLRITENPVETAQPELLYSNSLSADSMSNWIREGPVAITDGCDGVVLSSTVDADLLGDHAHFTVWCPQKFPDRIRVNWEYRPVAGAGLAMVFFGAQGASGVDLFSPELATRTGYYPQYHSSDINALHISYQRHKHASERAFRTCNLRKSAGFHLVAQGADPLPNTEDGEGYYDVELLKDGPHVTFAINGLILLDWTDDGVTTGPPVGAGYLGFRQMAPLQAAYRNLSVRRVGP